MAEVYATKDGVWSDDTVWNTGAAPTSSDDVYANTYQVTIDEDVSVATIRTQAGATAAAGGRFHISTDQTITTTGGFYAGTNSYQAVLNTTNASGTTVTITGNVTAQSSYCRTLIHSGTGDVVFNGDCSVSTNGSQLYLSGTGTLTCNGTYTGGYNSSPIYTDSTGTLIINGTVRPGGSGTAGGGSDGLSVQGATVVVINGDVEEASGGLESGVLIGAAADVTINGDVTGYAGDYMINSSSSGSFIVLNGTVTPYGGQPAVYSDGTVIMRGGKASSVSDGTRPIDAPMLLVDDTAELEMEFREDDSGLPGAARSLYTGGTDIGNPATTDVRDSTTFGPASEYTGTLSVPSASYVSQGVAVDSGVGTLANLDASGVRAAIGLASANLDTQLANIPTSTGNITVGAMTSGAIQDIFSTYVISESYAATGVDATPAQIMYMTQQAFTDFDITGPTITVRKIDGSTTASTYTLDDASTPTSRTRAT